jgi:hypothetical protein
MGKPEIIGVTVSVNLSDKNYGSGSESFISLQGRYPDPTILKDVLFDGIDMYFSAWESLLASRYATGAGTALEFKKALEDAKIRLSKVRAFLQKEEQQVLEVASVE